MVHRRLVTCSAPSAINFNYHNDDEQRITVPYFYAAITSPLYNTTVRNATSSAKYGNDSLSTIWIYFTIMHIVATDSQNKIMIPTPRSTISTAASET